MDDAHPVGVLIRATRNEKRWTLRELAARSGKAPQTINAVEGGDSKEPSLGTVLPITDALGISRARIYKLMSPPEGNGSRTPVTTAGRMPSGSTD
jgi:transcriptional regulator with XRE-family HTH domain